MMYFIKYHPLKERLRDRAMGDREALPYFIVIMTLTTLLMGLGLPWASQNRWDILGAILGAAIAVAGIVYCFVQNGGRAGYDFIQKSVVLGWVVTFRLLLPFVILAVGMLALKTGLGYSDESTTWIETVFTVVLIVIYYQRLGRHIQDTKKKPGEQPTSVA